MKLLTIGLLFGGGFTVGSIYTAWLFRVGPWNNRPDYCECGEKKIGGRCPLDAPPVSDEKRGPC